MAEYRHEWFAVRCLFAMSSQADQDRTQRLYEERITLWRASSAEALRRAEEEAREYAGEDNRYLGLAQSFQLFEDPADGAEVYSLMRESSLGDDEYLNAFFDTGSERQNRVQ